MSKRFYQLASLILLIALTLTSSNHTIYYDDYLQSTKLENSRTFTLLIDSSFTEQEKNIIIRAGHRWEKVTNNFIFLREHFRNSGMTVIMNHILYRRT